MKRNGLSNLWRPRLTDFNFVFTAPTSNANVLCDIFCRYSTCCLADISWTVFIRLYRNHWCGIHYVDQIILNVEKYDKRDKLHQLMDKSDATGTIVFVESKRYADARASMSHENFHC